MADFNMTRQTARSALPCGFPSFVTLLQQDVCACVSSMHASITQWPWAAMNIYGELLLASCGHVWLHITSKFRKKINIRMSTK